MAYVLYVASLGMLFGGFLVIRDMASHSRRLDEWSEKGVTLGTMVDLLEKARDERDPHMMEELHKHEIFFKAELERLRRKLADESSHQGPGAEASDSSPGASVDLSMFGTGI